MQTQDLISELVIGNTTFWQTEAFQQMRQGFHQAFNEMLPELTIPRVCESRSSWVKSDYLCNRLSLRLNVVPSMPSHMCMIASLAHLPNFWTTLMLGPL